MARTKIYGNSKDIAIFKKCPNSNIVIENGKLLSNEPYVEKLLKIYNVSFEKLSNKNDFRIGDVVSGSVVKTTPDEIVLDIGTKEYVYISTIKDKLNFLNYVPGDSVSAIITNTTGYLKGSISQYEKIQTYENLQDLSDDTVYDAKVVSLSNTGYTLDIGGISVFMPGSLGGVNKLTEFESLVGNTIKVLPIKNENKLNKFKGQIIVSHRAYLETLIPDEIEKLEIGKVYSGTVTGTKPFGVFVEFNNVLTGMIHKDDFDETLSELVQTNQVVPGTEIDFYLKEIVSNKKIILSRFPVETKEPESEVPLFVGEIVTGTVTKTVNYGSFVALGNKSGLIHISKLPENLILQKGESVSVKILDNKDNKYVLEFLKFV